MFEERIDFLIMQYSTRTRGIVFKWARIEIRPHFKNPISYEDIKAKVAADLPLLLYNYVTVLQYSHIFKHVAPFLFELFEIRGSQACYLFKLGGKMRHAAVMHLVSYFCKIELIVYQ
jgi:hypothetical protein